MEVNLTDAGKPLFRDAKQTPSIGRMVHYRPDPRTRSRKGGDWAAIITETFETQEGEDTFHVVYLTIFPPGEAPRALENPVPFYDPATSIKCEDAWGAWHWPERV